MAMKMAHLALEAGNMPEQADAAGDHPNPPSAGGGAPHAAAEHNYPPGAGMTLSHEELSKMGHKTPPKHGSMVHFEGHGHVKEITSHTGSDGNPQHSVHIQMTHLGMEKGEKKSHAEKIYGEKGEPKKEKKAEGEY
jgi:hypothetical protein